MKITQAQIRILRHRLHVAAERACETQRKLCEDNKQRNHNALNAALSKVMKKYNSMPGRPLVKEVHFIMGSVLNGYYAEPFSVSYDPAVAAECAEELRAAAKAVKIIGTEDYVKVAIPSLDMTKDEYRCRRGEDDRCMLRVPANEREAWLAVAVNIDMSFMDGDAKALMQIIDRL